MSSSPVADLRVVEVTIEIALEEISKQAPDAEKLLTLCAFLAPDDIPRRMLLSGAEAVPEAIRDPIRDSRAMIAAVSALTRFGLLDMQLNALGMHRVRQEAVRERLPLAEQRTWAMAAAKIVLHSFPPAPEPSDTWAWAARVLPHAYRAIDHLERLKVEPLVAIELRLRTARYLTHQGRLGSAEESLTSALAKIESEQPEGRLHATILNHLAVVEREYGLLTTARERATKALELHRKALATVPAHGKEQPEKTGVGDAVAATTRLPGDAEVADDLRNLGTIATRRRAWSEAMGNLNEAGRILVEREGGDTPSLAPVLDSLFELYVGAERWRDAEAVLRRTLAIREESGRGDTTEAKLDRFYISIMTEPENAVSRAGEIAAELEGAFGPLHPGTASGQLLLGTVLRGVGELDESRKHFERVVEIHRANFGPDHYRVAAGVIDLAHVAALAGDPDEAERRLRTALEIVMTAEPDDRADRLQLTGLDVTLKDLASDDRSRSFVNGVSEIVADATQGDETMVAAALRMAVGAFRTGGDVLLRQERRGEAAEVYQRGLGLARLTTDTPFDDADFLLRLGVIAAADEDATETIRRFRAALACMTEGNIHSPIWTLITQCGYLAADTPSWSLVDAALDSLLHEAREEGAVTEFHPSLTAMVPEGWFVKESMTLLAPDGQANVIASSEPLDLTIDTEQYATVQGDLLRKEFPDYEEKSFDPVRVLGDRDGYVRTFEWTPPDGVRVAQSQLYFAEGGRGYTATATTPAANLGDVEAVLIQVMRGLRVSREQPVPQSA